ASRSAPAASRKLPRFSPDNGPPDFNDAAPDLRLGQRPAGGGGQCVRPLGAGAGDACEAARAHGRQVDSQGVPDDGIPVGYVELPRWLRAMRIDVLELILEHDL